MGKYYRLARWLRRGRQRHVVAQAICRPLTSTQILSITQQFNPRIRLRDIWFHLKQMEAKALVHCLTPLEGNGKLFFLTDTGRAVVKRAFGITIYPLTLDIDWPLYSRVVRARVRRHVLCEIARGLGPQSKTASRIYRNLRDHYPVGRTRLRHALRDLVRLKLIISTELTPNRGRKLYRLTEAGKRIAGELLNSEPIVANP